jgi:type III pantothenate kinase
MAILEIDMGNTRSKWRLREGEALRGRGVCASESFPDLSLISHPLVAGQAVQEILLAAVCEEEVFESAVRRLRSFIPTASLERMITTSQSAGGVRCAYAEPATLGVDRWLAMLAAHGRRDPLVSGSMVVSCGTAVTMDFVRADGIHEGGYILPGLFMMRESLLAGTGRIRFELSAFGLQRSPGDSTAAAVQNGAVHAVLSTLERSRDDAAKRWGGKVGLWLTGGDASWLCDGVEQPWHYVEDLVLDGLRYAVRSK